MTNLERFIIYCSDQHKKLSYIDKKVSELYHNIEYNCKNDKEHLKYSKLLQKALQRRRLIKQTNSELESFNSTINLVKHLHNKADVIKVKNKNDNIKITI